MLFQEHISSTKSTNFLCKYAVLSLFIYFDMIEEPGDYSHKLLYGLCPLNSGLSPSAAHKLKLFYPRLRTESHNELSVTATRN
jgi:hypothetical protein